jgi:hypothetical protein
MRYDLIRSISLSKKTLFHSCGVRHVVFPSGHISHNGRNRHFYPALELLGATW